MKITKPSRPTSDLHLVIERNLSQCKVIVGVVIVCLQVGTAKALSSEPQRNNELHCHSLTTGEQWSSPLQITPCGVSLLR